MGTARSVGITLEQTLPAVNEEAAFVAELRPVLERATAALDEFDIPYEARVMSAHRTPEIVRQYVASGD